MNAKREGIGGAVGEVIDNAVGKVVGGPVGRGKRPQRPEAPSKRKPTSSSESSMAPPGFEEISHTIAPELTTSVLPSGDEDRLADLRAVLDDMD